MRYSSKQENLPHPSSIGRILLPPVALADVHRFIVIERGTYESDFLAHIHIRQDEPSTELITVDSDWPHAVDSSRRTELARNVVSEIVGRHPQGVYGLIGVEGASVAALAVAEYLLGEDVHVAFVGVVDPDNAKIDPRKGTTSSDSAPLSLSIDVFETAAREARQQSSSDTRISQPMRVHRGFDTPLHAVTDALLKAARTCAVAVPTTLENAYDPLLTLSNGRGADRCATVVCFPGAGASVISLLDFVLALDPATDAYGIQPRGLDGKLSPHRSVRTAARFYVKALAMSERCRNSPLHFVGHSFGGWLGMETAAQWSDIGGQVASVTMIDSSAPADPMPNPEDEGSALGRFVRILEMGSRMALPYADGPMKAPGFREALAEVQTVMAGAARARAAPDSLVGSYRTFLACIQTAEFIARSSIVPTNLVVALGENEARVDAFTRDDILRWKSVLPHLNVLGCSGDHASILKGMNATRLAAWYEESVLCATVSSINP